MFKSVKKTIGMLLACATALTLMSPVPTPANISAASDVTVNLSSEKQVIRGFGGMNHPTWIADLTETQRNTAFGNGANQLGFSILRIHVDENKSNWSKELATAKSAVAQGAIVFASPWNPPSDMVETFTRNGVAGQKRLKYSKYAAYAQYLNDFVTYMKNNGVNLYAISIQNEPDYAHTWTWWTPQEMLNFMKNYAGSINCKVIAPESFSYLKNMSDPILNDSQALANMDILGAHFYGTSVSNMSYPLFQQKGSGKDLWMTEVYVPNSDANSADRWPEAIDVAYNIHGAMDNGFQAYVWWYIRRQYGPMKEDGTISKRGYMMAHYSKFIRPGYVKVNATANPNTNVYTSAYKGDNKAVIVAINKGTSAVSQKFVLNGGTASKITTYVTNSSQNLASGSINASGTSFTAQLPAQSVTTFVINLGTSATTTPTATSTPNPGIGSTVKLTDGWYYIKNVNAQKYLQVTDNTGKAGQNVEIGTGTGVAGQKWYLTNTSDGYITLTSALGNYMIDVANASDTDGANIQIYNGYSGNAQKFVIKSTTTNGVYTIGTKASDSTKMLDAYN
ncbi:RICIN domain-containing protein, partial [Anaeromicropila populeti]